MGQFKKAIEDYSLEIEFTNNNPIKALNNRAFCYAKMNDFLKAINDYTSVLKIDSKNVHALHNRGISYERIEKYKEAIQDLTKVLEYDPKNANALFNRGCCYDK